MGGNPAEADLPEGAALQVDGTVFYVLRYPISYQKGGKEERVETVIVRRKTMADNLAIKSFDNPLDIAVTLISRLCDLELPIVSKMDDVDAEAIGEIIEGFTRPGRATGNSAPAP